MTLELTEELELIEAAIKQTVLSNPQRKLTDVDRLTRAGIPRWVYQFAYDALDGLYAGKPLGGRVAVAGGDGGPTTRRCGVVQGDNVFHGG